MTVAANVPRRHQPLLRLAAGLGLAVLMPAVDQVTDDYLRRWPAVNWWCAASNQGTSAAARPRPAGTGARTARPRLESGASAQASARVMAAIGGALALPSFLLYGEL